MGATLKRMGILMIAALSLCSCAAEEKPDPQGTVPTVTDAANRAKMQFAFCVSHQQNDFIRGATLTIQASAEKAGVQMTVLDGNQNAEKQAGQVENLITQGIDGILIEPISREGLAPAIAACKEAGIPVITFNQRVANQEAATSFVGVDMVQGGVMEMEEAAARLNGRGNIVILHGPMGGDAQVGRDQGYRSVLARYPEIRVVAEQSANWVRGDSYSIMENWIQSGKAIDAVVSQNDDMALGALKAVEEAKLGAKIRVFGLDATPDGLRAIQAGRLACTISQNADRQGAIAVNALIDAALGKEVSPEYIIDHVLITQENVDQYLK